MKKIIFGENSFFVVEIIESKKVTKITNEKLNRK